MLTPEIAATARQVANPGCFATAIQLGLLPLAQAEALRLQLLVKVGLLCALSQ